jgi:hypothetical protein
MMFLVLELADKAHKTARNLQRPADYLADISQLG